MSGDAWDRGVLDCLLDEFRSIRIVSEKLGSEAANPIFQFVADLHQTVRKRAVRGGFQS